MLLRREVWQRSCASRGPYWLCQLHRLLWMWFTNYNCGRWLKNQFLWPRWRNGQSYEHNPHEQCFFRSRFAFVKFEWNRVVRCRWPSCFIKCSKIQGRRHVTSNEAEYREFLSSIHISKVNGRSLIETYFDSIFQQRQLFKHRGRAHLMALVPLCSTQFYSCGEDGVCCLFDLRTSMKNSGDSIMLFDDTGNGQSIQLI